MSHAKRRLLPVLMAAAVGIGASATTLRADEATNQQMQQKIDQLETKVQNLESAQAENQADVTKSIQDVMNDANGHSTLLDNVDSGTGYDPANGFHLGSTDGNFYLHPFGLFQFEGVVNWRGGVKPADHGTAAPTNGTNFNDGFTIRRMKLGADGHIFSPNLGYFLQIDTMRTGGGLSLDDAYATYKLNDQLTLKGGQFKDIAWHESNVDDGYQLAADESMVNALIGGTLGGTGGVGSNQSRVQGVSLQYMSGPLRVEGALHDGYASQNTGFFDSTGGTFVATNILAGAVPPANWGFSTRAEYMIIGNQDTGWSEYNRFSARGDTSDVLVAGGGFDYTEFGDDHSFFWTGDVQYNMSSGLSLYGALLGEYIRTPSGAALRPGAKTTADSYGWLVQGGYLIPNTQWEPFARYDFTNLGGNLYGTANPPVGIGNHNLHEMTVGVNYYMYGHNAKFTLDGSYLPCGAPFDMDGLGYLRQSANHPEWVARAQFQLKI